MILTCTVCGADDCECVLRRTDVPAFQNALYKTQAAATRAQTGEIALTVCRQCGFVRNACFDAGLVAYGADYENDQSNSEVFLAHMDAMADRVLCDRVSVVSS